MLQLFLLYNHHSRCANSTQPTVLMIVFWYRTRGIFVICNAVFLIYSIFYDLQDKFTCLGPFHFWLQIVTLSKNVSCRYTFSVSLKTLYKIDEDTHRKQYWLHISKCTSQSNELSNQWFQTFSYFWGSFFLLTNFFLFTFTKLIPFLSQWRPT